MSETLRIPVSTPGGSYQVYVGTGLVAQVGATTRSAVGGTSAAIVCDTNVGPRYAGAVAQSLIEAGYNVTTIHFPAGERHKTIATLTDILEAIAAAGLTRSDVVVALGGGVCGDMAGLAAALYLRGIAVVQVPTSLLAMVDSSVGGKTAVDIPAGKNLVGAFWQPAAVIADVDVLATLPETYFVDACGEVIKHGVLADAALFERLAARPLTSATRNPDELARIVARNVEIKRDVVNADERERGLRQMLNLGHTIGHAIEAASDFSLGHGACVAAGLCAMARAAAANDWCDASVPARIEACVAAHGLPIDTDVDHATLLRFATHDKKRREHGINIIVPEDIGHASVRRISLDSLSGLIKAGCGVALPASS